MSIAPAGYAHSVSTYRLQREETLDEGVKRIVEELSVEALGYLEEDDPDAVVEAIHETRKLCKKGRGLVRLVRPALGDEYGKTNRLFRDAARLLSPIRDSHAILDTFNDLAAVKGLLDRRVAAAVRAELARRSREATEEALSEKSGRVEQAGRLIESARARALDWELPNGFDPIGDGIAKTYKRGRNGMSEAAKTRRPEAFHEWRKRVKYLWYQMRLTRDSAPSILRPLSKRLHDLSDALGDAHDLVVLCDDVQELDLKDHDKEVMTTVATGMRVNLEERALSLGPRLYVEKPSDFVGRLAAYWDVWQEGDELKVGEIADLFPTESGAEDTDIPDLFALPNPGRAEHSL